MRCVVVCHEARGDIIVVLQPALVLSTDDDTVLSDDCGSSWIIPSTRFLDSSCCFCICCGPAGDDACCVQFGTSSGDIISDVQLMLSGEDERDSSSSDEEDVQDREKEDEEDSEISELFWSLDVLPLLFCSFCFCDCLLSCMSTSSSPLHVLNAPLIPLLLLLQEVVDAVMMDDRYSRILSSYCLTNKSFFASCSLSSIKMV